LTEAAEPLNRRMDLRRRGLPARRWDRGARSSQSPGRSSIASMSAIRSCEDPGAAVARPDVYDRRLAPNIEDVDPT
jgi:hypothetical protein